MLADIERLRATAMRKIFLLMVVVVISPFVLADESAWSIDKPTDKIPDTPLTGRIFGKEFKLASAKISNGFLHLFSSRDGQSWSDAMVTIYIGTDQLQNEVVVNADSDEGVPRVDMEFTRPGKKMRSSQTYERGYSMRLTVVSRTDSEIRAKIHISFPDYQKSYLIGTVTLKVW